MNPNRSLIAAPVVLALLGCGSNSANHQSVGFAGPDAADCQSLTLPEAVIEWLLGHPYYQERYLAAQGDGYSQRVDQCAGTLLERLVETPDPLSASWSSIAYPLRRSSSFAAAEYLVRLANDVEDCEVIRHVVEFIPSLPLDSARDLALQLLDDPNCGSTALFPMLVSHYHNDESVWASIRATIERGDTRFSQRAYLYREQLAPHGIIIQNDGESWTLQP